MRKGNGNSCSHGPYRGFAYNRNTRQARMRMTNRRPRRCTQTLFRSAIFAAAVSCAPAHAACNFDVLKQGSVAAIIDARTFRLADGQEVRLAGIELLRA